MLHGRGPAWGLDLRRGRTRFDCRRTLKSRAICRYLSSSSRLRHQLTSARDEAGASAFLRKPFEDEALLALISAAVRLPPTTPRE